MIKCRSKDKASIDFICRILYSFALKMRSIRIKQQNVIHGSHVGVIIHAARQYLRRTYEVKQLIASRHLREKNFSGSLATIKAITDQQIKILNEGIQQSMQIHLAW